MPARTAAEKLARKQELEAKREARRLAKEKKEKEKADSRVNTKDDSSTTNNHRENKGECYILSLSDDCLGRIITFCSSRDIGALALTCRQGSISLVEARVPFIMSRLNSSMCSNQSEARTILQQSYGGGDTKRICAKGKAGKQFVSEFVSYARFLEEAAIGYSTQNYGGRKPTLLPTFVNGRFVSISPEHSLSRVGGGKASGAGGSGVASWGVGKRGQLGHGQREDEPSPRMLLGGIGYGIRIVQVSAGGGLVRVAHTLLLTSSGRVMSL